MRRLPSALVTFLLLQVSFVQSLAEDRYLVMDLVVSPQGTVFYDGQTSVQPVVLDPRLGSPTIDSGRFSNSTDLLTNKTGHNWTLRLSLPQSYDDALVNVFLPRGASVVGASPPDRWAIFQEKGEIVVRFYGKFTAGDTVEVNYELGSEESSSGSLLMLVGLIALTLAVAGAVLRARPGSRVVTAGVKDEGRLSFDRTKIDAILPTLTERERLILEAVIEEGGKISQRKLKHLSGLPKSSLSRITDELQRKGLIRKIPVGQTNEIRIDKGLLTDE